MIPRTILILATLVIECFLLIYWYRHEGSVLQFLGFSHKELHPSYHYLLQIIERLSLSLYGLSIVVLEIRFLSEVDAQIGSRAIRAPQVMQMIAKQVVIGLMPLIAALLVYTVVVLLSQPASQNYPL